MTATYTTTSSPPPPVPTHKSPLPALDISIIQPHYNNDKSSTTFIIDPPKNKSTSYLGQQQQQQSKKRVSLLLDYDSTSSSDESEGGYSNRFSSSSINYSNTTEEHKFWQVHSSTTIIAPPMTATEYTTAIDMAYVNPRSAKKPRPSLATQVHDILGSTLDDVDEEIEQEWENSRIQLRKNLIILPTLSLSSPSY